MFLKTGILFSIFLPLLVHLDSIAASSATGQDLSHKFNHLYNITEDQTSTFVLPTDVAVYKSRIYIVDSGNNRIVVCSSRGKPLFAFGSEGTLNGEFLDPVGIATGKDGSIYVADTGNHRIQIFDHEGSFLGSFPVVSDKKSIRPVDVVVDPVKSHLYVTGNNNHKVMVFTKKGKLVREWGGNGADVGKFRYPATIAVTKDSRVGVVDVLNTRVQLFEGNGEFLVQVGEWGVLPGQLFRPKGVAIDRHEYIYISDSYMNVIQVFDDSGKFLYFLDDADTKHKMMTPAGMAIDDKGRLYVAEMLKHRISAFQLE